MGISAAQLLLIAALNQAPFAWLWGCICLFMFTIALTMPNATVIALDPLPKIAGVASSIIGTLQNISGAAGAIIGALIYNGTVRNSVIMMAVARRPDRSGVPAQALVSARTASCAIRTNSRATRSRGAS